MPRRRNVARIVNNTFRKRLIKQGQKRCIKCVKMGTFDERERQRRKERERQRRRERERQRKRERERERERQREHDRKYDGQKKRHLR